MSNPFTITFGKKPEEYISRTAQMSTIIDTFTSDVPSAQVYMITGVRGSGKTVLLSAIGKEMAAMDKWMVIDLNPTRDLLK